MANQLLNEIFTEDKLVQLWPDFPCLYDVQSSDFKNRDLRQQAMEAIATQVEQSGAYFVVVCTFRGLPQSTAGMFTIVTVCSDTRIPWDWSSTVGLTEQGEAPSPHLRLTPFY